MDATQYADGRPLDESSSEPDVYARESGLTIDSQVDAYSLFIHYCDEIYRAECEYESQDLLDDDSLLPQLQIPSMFQLHEKLDASNESSELLQTSLAISDHDDPDLKATVQRSRRECASLKVEEPLLRSDPDFDHDEYVRSMDTHMSANLDQINLPYERLDELKGEGARFPEVACRYKTQIDAEIHDERIEIHRNTLHHLQSMLRTDFDEDDQRKMLEEPTMSWRACRTLTLTPPLSPLLPSDSYFIPDAEACEVPILSDPDSLLQGDLEEAERNLMQQNDTGDRSSFLEGELPTLSPLLKTPPLLDRNLPKMSCLKVESPLTPQGNAPTSCDIQFPTSEVDKSLDLDGLSEDKRWTECVRASHATKDPNGVFSDELLSMLEGESTSLMRKMEQQRLDNADAVARVDIPVVDFSIPEPAWRKLPFEAAAQLAWIRETYDVFDISTWKSSASSAKTLNWVPFSNRMGEVAIQETFADAPMLGTSLQFPGEDDIPTSASYVWKQPGLSILREPEDDTDEDQLQPVKTRPEEKSLDSLIRKRARENSEDQTQNTEQPSSPSPVDLLEVPDWQSLPTHENVKRGTQTSGLLLGINDQSATSTLLSNYVEFRTAKKQKNGKSSFFPNAAKSDLHVSGASSKPQRVSAPGGAAKRSGLPVAIQPMTVMPAAPCPPSSLPLTPAKIIKALTLSRKLFAGIEKLYPAVNIIERDFNRWDKVAWDPNSISRSPVVSPLAAEADVIVSPVTGIVVTTLLTALQKPLPGHKGQAAIRERISSVAARYERLIILVSQNNSDDESTRDLTSHECASYTEFLGFVTALDTNAQAYYIGGGGDTLIKWLVFFIGRYAAEAASIHDLLIEDESCWEVFLRRAGMNAYAAQGILGILKTPQSTAGEENGSEYGLPVFLRLTPEERIERYGGLLGGARVLDRVNKVLERSWT
ncbi:hypothetical protein F4778DRAFT_783304 [Xylariomycetidae sp. FL2044]|nr:hypothetical protein F4778DRAFT_783304 [Xylariomycetidae sp. FL2044]